jgi:hypothetical protein
MFETEIMPAKSLEECLYIDQCAFGYINKDVPKDYIATFGLGSCIGLYLKDSKKGMQALAHIDRKHKESTQDFLNYLKELNLSSGKYENVLIFKSYQASSEDIDKIVNTLKIYGINNIEIITNKPVFDIIFDKEGRMYNLETGKEMGKPILIRGLKIMAKQKITCQNYESINPKAEIEMENQGFKFETNMNINEYEIESFKKTPVDIVPRIINYCKPEIEIALTEAYDCEGRLIKDCIGIWTKKV